ncbi:conserved hypothetical protein, partial [delta proteobacterium NaphS2]
VNGPQPVPHPQAVKRTKRRKRKAVSSRMAFGFLAE